MQKCVISQKEWMTGDRQTQGNAEMQMICSGAAAVGNLEGDFGFLNVNGEAKS